MKFFERFSKNPVEQQAQPPPDTAKESPKTPYSSPKETELLEREVTMGRILLGGNIGDAQLIKLKDDGSGVFKPHSGYEQVRADQFIARERAAYLINLFLGFNFVPPTVIREVRGKKGSLQEFIDDADTAGEVDYETIEKEELNKLRAFDSIILNIDRHEGNYLIKNGKIYAIDHGHSLLGDYTREIQPKFDRFDPAKLPREVLGTVTSFAKDQDKQNILRNLLSEILDEEIVDYYMERILLFTKLIPKDRGKKLDQALT